MRLFRICFLPLISLLTSFHSFAQDYPKDFFRMPIDSTVSLAGNFGEIRFDHFHYGWDIRTGGKERMKIIAAGDGYVSRIKVSPYGYGKVIYITHPNGYMTVYAHLSSFNDSIGKFVKNAQYKDESYEVELFPKPGELPVKKGELIALSGNTGASEAPHLHFEIRDERTEEIINPYLFGLSVPDTKKPVFKTLAVYPVMGKGWSNTGVYPSYFPIQKKNGKWTLTPSDSVIVEGKIGFGIECYDSENGTSGNNQVYSLEFELDGKRIYYYEMTRFAFDQTLFVNSHIDYQAQRKNRKNIQRAFILPGNRFPIYSGVLDAGLSYLDSNKVHQGTFIASDFFGNTSTFTFSIYFPQKNKNGSVIGPAGRLAQEIDCFDHSVTIPIAWEKEFHYADSSFYSISIPDSSFYENSWMIRCLIPTSSGKVEERKEKLPHTYSLLFRFPGKYVPLHNKYSLSLKVDTLVPDPLKSKLLIVAIDENRNFSSKGGEFKDGWVTTQTRSFGAFAVAIDSTAPRIKEPKLPKGNNIAALKELSFIINDNLSGIKNYRVTLDGKWILFEYEPKKRSLFCKNTDLPAGKHTLKVVVTDEKDNQRVEWFTYTK
jgi:hypothetical protein